MQDQSISDEDTSSDTKSQSQRIAELIREDPSSLRRAWESEEFPFEHEDESPQLQGEEFESIEFSNIRFFPNCQTVIFTSCYFESCNFESNTFSNCHFRDAHLSTALSPQQ